MAEALFAGGPYDGRRQAVGESCRVVNVLYMKPLPLLLSPPPRPRWWRHPLRWLRWRPSPLPPIPEPEQLAYRDTGDTRDGARVYEIDGDWPWFRGPEIGITDPDRYRALVGAYGAVHPRIRADRQTRWVMDLDWYKRIRTIAMAVGRDPDGDNPSKWKPSPDDLLMGIRIDVRDGGGRPHLENRRYPAGYPA